MLDFSILVMYYIHPPVWKLPDFCCLLTSVCIFPSIATINLQHIGEQAEAMFGVGYVIIHK